MTYERNLRKIPKKMNEFPIQKVIRQRKSIRDFKPEPVPKELIEKIIEAGIWAPSNSNRQPWEFIVVTGNKLKELNEKLREALEIGKSSKRELKTWDDAYPRPKEGERRSRELMKGMLEYAQKAGLKPQEFIKRNFSFFGAPVVIVVLMEKGYGYGSLVSVGACIENMLLQAWELGLGTCWMMIPLEYGDVFRELFEIPEDKYLVSTIALGYASDSPINEFRSTRDPIEKFIKWYE